MSFVFKFLNQVLTFPGKWGETSRETPFHLGTSTSRCWVLFISDEQENVSVCYTLSISSTFDQNFEGGEEDKDKE